MFNESGSFCYCFIFLIFVGSFICYTSITLFQILPGSRQFCLPSNSKSDRNLGQSDNITGITAPAVASRSSSRASLAQLLPPPQPSAPILNPVAATASGEKKQPREYHQSTEADTNERESVARSIDFKHQSSSSLLADSDLPHEANEKSAEEHQSRKMEDQQRT